MPPSSSEMLLTEMLSLLNLLMGARIKGIAQGIPDDVNADDGHRDGYPRKKQEPRRKQKPKRKQKLKKQVLRSWGKLTWIQ